MAIITLQGNEIHTSGNLPEKGREAPDFLLVNKDLEDKSLKDFTKKKLMVIVPSIDTPICALSTMRFNEIGERHQENIEVLVVSADLPFAMARFCGAEAVNNVIMLSTMRSQDFARDYGVLIMDGPLAGVTARAVIALDEKNQVVYTQLVSEISEEPDYETALGSLI